MYKLAYRYGDSETKITATQHFITSPWHLPIGWRDSAAALSNWKKLTWRIWHPLSLLPVISLDPTTLSHGFLKRDPLKFRKCLWLTSPNRINFYKPSMTKITLNFSQRQKWQLLQIMQWRSSSSGLFLSFWHDLFMSVLCGAQPDPSFYNLSDIRHEQISSLPNYDCLHTSIYYQFLYDCRVWGGSTPMIVSFWERRRRSAYLIVLTWWIRSSEQEESKIRFLLFNEPCLTNIRLRRSMVFFFIKINRFVSIFLCKIYAL